MADTDSLADHVAEAAIKERDKARAELARVKARLGSLDSPDDRIERAEADAQHWEGKAASLSAAVRHIVNDPHMPRSQVQSRLLVALQKYDQ